MNRLRQTIGERHDDRTGAHYPELRAWVNDDGDVVITNAGTGSLIVACNEQARELGEALLRIVNYDANAWPMTRLMTRRARTDEARHRLALHASRMLAIAQLADWDDVPDVEGQLERVEAMLCGWVQRLDDSPAWRELREWDEREEERGGTR